VVAQSRVKGLRKTLGPRLAAGGLVLSAYEIHPEVSGAHRRRTRQGSLYGMPATGQEPSQLTNDTLGVQNPQHEILEG